MIFALTKLGGVYIEGLIGNGIFKRGRVNRVGSRIVRGLTRIFNNIKILNIASTLVYPI